MKTILRQSLKTILVIAGLFGIVALVSAWTAPTAAPPGGNVSAPVNVGGIEQVKTGALGVSGAFKAFSDAIFSGKVGIGTTNPQNELEVAGRLKAVTIQITGESPTAGKVLTALNSAGSAIWQTPSAGGITNSSFQRDEYYLEAWSGAPTPITMGSVDKYFVCALSQVSTQNPSGATLVSKCEIKIESGSWKLTSNSTKGQSFCKAYCIKVK